MAVPTVFLNYRDVDVRTFARTFARSLYNRLSLNYREVDVRTLRQELQVGYNLTSQIEQAINRSLARVHVVIFSPRFAESEWCLRELVMMLKSGAPIIPVFYRVQAAEVRYAREVLQGRYTRHLQMLAEEQTEEGEPLYDSEEIDNWRDALFHAANFFGFYLTFNGELESLEEVVHGICESLEEVVKEVRESLEDDFANDWHGNPNAVPTVENDQEQVVW